MSELTKEKIYKKELEKVGGEGNNNLERIRSLGGGGTTVVANPELSGDEADLTGLQVGETKYKVPQGSGGGIEFVDIEGKSGEFTQQEYAKLQNGAIIRKGTMLFFYAGEGDEMYYTSTPHPSSTGDMLTVSSVNINTTTLEWHFASYDIAVMQ